MSKNTGPEIPGQLSMRPVDGETTPIQKKLDTVKRVYATGRAGDVPNGLSGCLADKDAPVDWIQPFVTDFFYRQHMKECPKAACAKNANVLSMKSKQESALVISILKSKEKGNLDSFGDWLKWGVSENYGLNKWTIDRLRDLEKCLEDGNVEEILNSRLGIILKDGAFSGANHSKEKKESVSDALHKLENQVNAEDKKGGEQLDDGHTVEH